MTDSNGNGNRLDAPHFHRNRDPILETMTPMLVGRSGHALEIGCGTGQHVAAFAAAFPGITWWPSDIDAANRASADAWRALDNQCPALALDATSSDWKLDGESRPPDGLTLIYSFNVIHISPWQVAEGIAAGAGRHLADDGIWVLYGPYKRGGRHTAPSNEAFDQSLRARDPSWGVRNLEDVQNLAAANGLLLTDVKELPANNLIVVFRR
ncbi:MAG: DUF938 domain-containing protein [Rhodospirillales bacterium]